MRVAYTYTNGLAGYEGCSAMPSIPRSPSPFTPGTS